MLRTSYPSASSPVLLSKKEYKVVRNMLLMPVILFYREMLETVTNKKGEPELALKDYHRAWQAIARSKANIYGELEDSEETYLELWLAHRDKLDARQRKFLLLTYRYDLEPIEIGRRYGLPSAFVTAVTSQALEVLLSCLHTASSDVTGQVYEAYRLTLELMPDTPAKWRANLPARPGIA